MKALLTTVALAALASSLITFNVTRYFYPRMPKPQVGDVFTSYYDRRNDAYWHTNDWYVDINGELIRPPAQSVCVEKIIRIEGDTAYTSMTSVDISNLTNLSGWGPVVHYTNPKYRNYFIRNPNAARTR